MEPERLVLLRADIEAQLAEIDSIYDRIDARATVPGEDLDLITVAAGSPTNWSRDEIYTDDAR